MTTPSNPWGDERRRLSHQLPMRDHFFGRHQARRLSRRFARVGVEIPPGRLREMLAGMPVSDDEMTSVSFALIAIRLNHENRVAKMRRLQRCCRRALISVGLAIVALNFLLCIGYLFLTLTQHASSW
ncbi:hypothetical protein B4U45_14765 [Mycobacterium persicum]|uniref:Uncharacterized protein n=2 Tax=Mycobacterium persicum TaxID=1487726 RepID=A0A8E2IR61_9MYCO|nr:hypothetical protein [Mycobacterium persicum]KZS85301.1 hypothetical protein A4G31_13920 [Mycobacterium persicum]ORB44332.1 hypothetical protein BST40_19840 [Mycobacterium persicum]ORB95706.1 hypothetical protein B1T44_15745 [Mycobacterium persicum]ORC02470.1 hypothetical protein B1T48_15565 [Mycobacterium persicum]ORC07672.1 hypothetical protein B4U45_14765 [Mycobacterium persicum]